MLAEQHNPLALQRGSVRPAGVQNYLLGGKDHFAAERTLAEALIATVPNLRHAEQGNRRWRSRTVARLVGEEGVLQFLDLGAGFPDSEHTHVVAQQAAPTARVVYADAEPTVMVHGRALDVGSPEGELTHLTLAAAFCYADLLQLLAVQSVLDLSRPVAVLACGFLQYAPDLVAAQAQIAALVSALAPGSYLAVSHPLSEGPTHGWGLGSEAYREAGLRLQTVTLSAVRGYLAGLDLVGPGWQPTSDWLSGDDKAPEPAGDSEYWAAIGRKP
ncbi:SAM-dependent methyltransferase [Streptacidiphilus sp. EB103A]|uniref:SAM-dependent methyltransferase n=1 Tax=Streptacidiphilus sp. EB103A TaxID=3156275 RepID=UPI003512F956